MKYLIFTIVFFCCLALRAKNYYVATTCAIGNTGTYISPFSSLQAAADVVNPGDTVIVRDGIYRNSVPNYQSWKLGMVLLRSGTADSIITFKAEHVGGAIIDCTSDGSTMQNPVGILLNPASYIRIEGFEIRKAYLAGIMVMSGSTHVEIRNNYIHDIGNYCITSVNDDGNGRTGINLVNCFDILIEGNRIHNVGRLRADEGCKDAYHTRNRDHGVYIDGCDRLVVRNNVITDCNNGWCLHFYSTKHYSVKNVVVANNTFYTPVQHQPGLIILSCPITGMDIANNILIMQDSEVVDGLFSNVGICIEPIYEPYLTNITVRNNIKYRGNNTLISLKSASITKNLMATNPLVNDFAIYDFRLQPNSPAINSGVSVIGVIKDFTNNDRIGYPDIGAYEYNIPH